MMVSEMDRSQGTKWFTFYTKVRPCITYFSTGIVAIDFFLNKDIYMNHLLLQLDFLGTLVNAVLALIVLVLSCGDYERFVGFVKGVLIYETIYFPISTGINNYYEQKYDTFSEAIFVIAVMMVVWYFVWYRLNIKYFTKRLQCFYY